MPPLKKIDKAPPKVAAALKRLRKEGHTVDEIHAAMKEMGFEVARSTTALYVANVDAVAKEMRRTLVMADGLVGEFGEDVDDKTMRLNAELLKTGILRLQLAAMGTGTPPNAQECYQLSSALQRIVAARAADSERQRKERKAMAEEMARKVDAVAADAEKEKMTPEQILARIRREVYGIIDQPAKA